MDFTNYEKNIYKEIEKDEVLSNFFINLTNRANAIVSFEAEKINKANNVIKPSFDELSKLISTLKKQGIITAKEGYEIDFCTRESIYEQNVTPYFIIFSTLEFYGISFVAPDIEHMQNYNDTENYIKNMESNYKEWFSANKSIYRKLEQYQKKFDKLKGKGRLEEQETYDLQSEIFKMKEIIKNDEKMRLKIQFFKERSIEKSTQVLSVHNAIEKLSKEYEEYLLNKKKADAEIQKLYKTVYDRVFEEIDKNSMVEFDTSEIERRLFKLLVFNKLQKSAFIDKVKVNPEEIDTSSFNFDTTAVNWFIRTKKQSFNNLFSYVFDNFEASMEEIAQKVLKK